MDIACPGGFQYSVFSADYRGYAAIGKDDVCVLKSIYYFSGQTAQVLTGRSGMRTLSIEGGFRALLYT